MHGSDWLALMRKIPVDLHDAVAVTLTNNTELVVQQVFRIDREFMVLKARISGTTDAVRVAVVPYHQIAFVSMLREVPEANVFKLFGQGVASPAPVVRQVAEHVETLMPEVRDDSTPVEFELSAAPAPMPIQPAEPESVASTAKPGQVSKSILLARLRERLGQKSR